MIVNKKNMLEANSRCEEWTDTRITKFMNTPPYQKKGQKNIQNFIDSVGICDITYEEIFWVVLNNHLTVENRIDMCINYLQKFSKKLNENFFSYINHIKLIANTYKKENFELEIKSIINDMNSKMTNITNELGDINTNYKLFKITKVLLENILNDTDMIIVTKKLCEIMILEFPEDYSYNIILREMQKKYE